jgi:NADP-dependent 3-hydroxy acid dehydrogenase YdfG/acyl carrier protein
MPELRLLQETMSLVRQNKIKPIKAQSILALEDLQMASTPTMDDSGWDDQVLEMPEDVSTLPSATLQQCLKFRGDAAYLVAGGLGGLGRAISTYMAEHGARHIVYLSRTAGTKVEHQSFFRELEVQGCTIEAIQCDISSLESVQQALRQVAQPIAGVLQMAMSLSDQPFLSMTHDDWVTAIKPKVDGTWNLHTSLLEAEGQHKLDFFVMLGSISGAFGMPGQANYAAGNSFQNAFVQYRQALGLPASVIEVGIMGEIGYVSENKDVHEYFRTSGMPFLSEAQLLDAFHLSTLQQYPKQYSTASTIGSGGVDPGLTSRSQITLGMRATKPMTDPTNRTLWKRDRKADIYRNIEAAHLHSAMSGSASGEAAEDKIALLLASLHSSSPDAATAILDTPATLGVLTQEIGVFIYESMLRSVEEEEMDLERSLLTLGVDSLVTVEVRSWLRRRLDVEVSTLEMLNGGTIQILAQLVLARLKKRFAA